jgi:hypothetical protein
MEVITTTAQWAKRGQKYRLLRKKIASDLSGKAYMDDALAPPSPDAGEDHLVQAFAAQIPNTHGAPKQHAAVEQAASAG